MISLSSLSLTPPYSLPNPSLTPLSFDPSQILPTLEREAETSSCLYNINAPLSPSKILH